MTPQGGNFYVDYPLETRMLALNALAHWENQ
jgi:hypothetical protein